MCHFAVYYDDGSEKQMAIRRVNGKAVGTVQSAKLYDIIGPRSTIRIKNMRGEPRDL